MQAANAWPASACPPEALAAQLAVGGEAAAQRTLSAYLRCRPAGLGSDLGSWLWSGLEQAVAELRQALAEAAVRKAVPAGRGSFGHLASASGSWDDDAADAAAAAAQRAAARLVEGAGEAAAADLLGAPAASAPALDEDTPVTAEASGMPPPALESSAGERNAEAPETRGAAAPGEASDEDMRRLMVEALALLETPATPLGSFPGIFAAQLALGTLSRRRLYAAAQEVRSAHDTWWMANCVCSLSVSVVFLPQGS